MVKKFIILYLILGSLLLLAKDNTIEIGNINKYHYVSLNNLDRLLNKCYLANKASIKDKFLSSKGLGKDEDVFSILDDKCSKFKEYRVAVSQIVKSLEYLSGNKQHEFMLDMTTYVYRVFKKLSMSK